MQKLVLFLVLWVLYPYPLSAYEDSRTPPFLTGEQFRLKLRTNYHYTEDNFINRFQSEPLRQTLRLKGGPSPFFHFMRSAVSFGYSPFGWLATEAFLEGSWFAQSGNGTRLYFSSPKAERVGGALRGSVWVGEIFGIIPEVSFSYPFFSINYNTQTPVTDDGVWHFTPSLWLSGVLFGIVYPFAYAGFKWRGRPLSSLFQWKAGLLLKADIAEIGLYSRGFQSVILDQSSSLIGDRVNLLKRVNAGSLRFFASNPNVIGGTGWLAWHFPYLTLRFSADMDFIGARYSKGYGVLVELIIKMGKVHKTKVQSVFNNRSAGFEPNIDDSAMVEESFEKAQEPPSMDEEEVQSLLNEHEFMEEQKIPE